MMIHITYTDKAIILDCPTGQQYCISNSSDGATSTVMFSPDINKVVLSLIVSLGPEWKGGSASVGLQLMGVDNAIPLPPLDQMTIELLECECSVSCPSDASTWISALFPMKACYWMALCVPFSTYHSHHMCTCAFVCKLVVVPLKHCYHSRNPTFMQGSYACCSCAQLLHIPLGTMY